MPLENLIRFPALGDWGGTEYASYYVPLQEWNAQLMDDLCAEDSCDFVVSVGDNFYETGVKNIGLLNQNRSCLDCYKVGCVFPMVILSELRSVYR